MNSISEDLKKLEELKAEVVAAEQRALAHKQEIIERHSPVKIGDDVVVNVYSHKGKTIQVDRVGLRDCFGGFFRFEATGFVKKANGAAGLNRGEWRSDSFK